VHFVNRGRFGRAELTLCTALVRNVNGGEKRTVTSATFPTQRS